MKNLPASDRTYMALMALIGMLGALNTLIEARQTPALAFIYALGTILALAVMLRVLRSQSAGMR